MCVGAALNESRWNSRSSRKKVSRSASCIASASSARRSRSLGARWGAESRSKSGSMRSRTRYTSVHSTRLSRSTHAPEFATRRTRPSASSWRSASRTGRRLAPNCAASSSWRIREPGASSPCRICWRRPAAMRAEAGPGSTLTSGSSRGGVPRVPQARRRRGVGLVDLAVGEAHELEQHAPRAEEVDPSLPLAVTRACRRLAEDTHPVPPQVLDRRVKVLEVEREVVATDVAVARLGGLSVGGLPLEDLEVGSVLAAVEAQLTHDRARVHVEALGHPVGVLVHEGTERVDVLAPDDVDEEAVRLLDVGDGEADVLGAEQSGERH